MAAPIFVDFDGTLTTGEGKPWWEDPLDERVNVEMGNLINDLYHESFPIIIYTARREEVREETEYYLNDWGIKYHALRMEKPGYALFIDDKAISDGQALDLGVQGIKNRIYGDE